MCLASTLMYLCLVVIILCNLFVIMMGNSVRSLMYFVFFFQAEDGIRDLVRSRGLGDVYKRQEYN